MCVDGEATDEDKAALAMVADRIGTASGGDLPDMQASVEEEQQRDGV